PKVPNVNGIRRIGAREPASVSAQSQRRHLAGMAVQENDRLVGFRIPDTDRRVPPRRENTPASRAPGTDRNQGRGSADNTLNPAVLHVTDEQELVLTGGGQLGAVGAERQGADRPKVATKLADELAVGSIPETDHAVVVAGGGKFRAGRECQRRNPRFLGNY